LAGKEKKTNLEEVNNGVSSMPSCWERIKPLFQALKFTAHQHGLHIPFQYLHDEFSIFTRKGVVEGWLG
jgi:hypothetical protein